MDSSVVFFCFHLGAGAKPQSAGRKRKVLNKLLKEVLQLGCDLIKAKSNGKNFVSQILSKMENCEYTNAGFGSNLTSKGQPELECAIMGSENFYYAVAGCSNLKNPSAYLGRIYEYNLSGSSRLDSIVFNPDDKFLRKLKLEPVPSSSLISNEASANFKNWFSTIDGQPSLKENKSTFHSDTVGLICITKDFNIISANSSGGHFFKTPGRLGSSIINECGIDVDVYEESGLAVKTAVICSGDGEKIIQSKLANLVLKNIYKFKDQFDESLRKTFEGYRGDGMSDVGCLVVKATQLSSQNIKSNEKRILVEYGMIHSTQSFLAGISFKNGSNSIIESTLHEINSRYRIEILSEVICT